MAKKQEITDPYAIREAKKYANPIPSREYILQLMTEHGQLLTLSGLEKLLGLKTKSAKEALGFRLSAMLRDGQIIKTRQKGFGLPQKMSLVRGVVVGHPDGYGFVKAESANEKYFVAERQMRAVIHGDTVLIRSTGKKVRGFEDAVIVEVLQRNTEEVVGRFHTEQGAFFVVPESRRIQHHIIIPPGACETAENGDIVMVRLIAQPDKHQAPVGKVIQVIGQHMAPGMEIDIAIRVHNLPFEWPVEVTEELETVPTRVLPTEIATRLDLRDMPFVTIDGEDAKDFDDAVYAEAKKNGWHLYVAIADVAHYVSPTSALDQEARRRGNSVYFPGRVIPMLPFQLSAGICSLKPEVNRLALVCKVDLSKTGKIRGYEFFEATICSKARLTYTKVAAILEKGDPYWRQRYGFLLPHLEVLHDIFEVLHHDRSHRGALDLDLPETKIVFSSERKIESIERVERNNAHRLIEECMLVANVCAAKYILQHSVPGLFRVHPRPDQESLSNFRAFLASLGLVLGGGEDPQSLDYARLLRRVLERDDAQAIQMALLRSLQQAVYQGKNVGHFGLAYDAYTHYTSPIRRYPDLLIHRAIKQIIHQRSMDESACSQALLDQYGAHCSMTERRADEATRDVTEWLKCEYMQDKIGQEFPAKVNSVMAFGLFVTLEDVYVEGLVHVTSLPNDYYQFDPIHHQLTGERAGLVFKMGDPLVVRLVRVDLDERKMDFDLGDNVEKRVVSKRRRRSQSHG